MTESKEAILSEKFNGDATEEPNVKAEKANIFRVRKRPQKIRTRGTTSEAKKSSEEKPGNEIISEVDGAEPTAEELLLLRKAQQLRERSRMSSLDVTTKSFGSYRCNRTLKNECKRMEPGPDGLSSQFSVERGGLATQERMDKFIQNGLREKFGDRGESAVQSKPVTADVEEFEIPKELDVVARPLYDPSEGMPSAGLEEVDIPIDDKQKCVTEAMNARRQILTKRRERARPADGHATAGNISSNFLHHRQKWMETRLPHWTSQEYAKSKTDNKDQDITKDDDSKDKDHRKSLTGKRFIPATDAAFAERWKKRWRR